jgi:hypothetical protein
MNNVSMHLIASETFLGNRHDLTTGDIIIQMPLGWFRKNICQ